MGLWYEEYLLSLREQWKDLHEINFCNKVKVNDVVLVKGPPDKKRLYWHLGRILELLPGSDGKVRSVRLKKGDGDIAHHSLNHLYPMELALTHDHVAKAPDHSNQSLSESPDLTQPTGGRSESIGRENTEVESISPDNFESQVLVGSDLEPSSAESGDPCEVTPTDNVQPAAEASVEEARDQAESAADSFSIDDQGIDHFSQIQNLDLPDQDLNSVNNPLGEVSDSLSGRPRRKAALRGRPLDDQFEYY